MYDFEKSSETYEIPFKKRVDFYDKTEGKELTPLETFKWFYDEINGIKSGDYRVIAGDPLSDIEIGLADFIASKHADYVSSLLKASDRWGVCSGGSLPLGTKNSLG